MKSLLTVTLYSNTDELSYRKSIASLMHNIVAETQKPKEVSMWAFLDGEFVQEKERLVQLENRGLTFADGLFEVIRTLEGRILFFEDHYSRMKKSAEFFNIEMRFPSEEARRIAVELVKRNGIEDGELYIELTRGTDPHRDHRYPPKETRSTFFMLALPLRKIDSTSWRDGVKLLTYPDLRHGLCEHKTINLLPNVLAKNFAYARGGYEALMFRESNGKKYATEGGSSNYFFVKDGVFYTPEVDNILSGITRGKVISLVEDLGYEVVEKRIALEEFFNAEEVFLASTVSRVMPVRAIDDVSFEVCGKHTAKVMRAYEDLFFSAR
ncbi:MAG: D-alanine transaminase [Mesotoga sp.]|nr:D-alanine transaminase [Mesotoga sp.]